MVGISYRVSPILITLYEIGFSNLSFTDEDVESQRRKVTHLWVDQ